MKKLLMLLALIFTTSIFAQTDNAKLESRFVYELQFEVSQIGRASCRERV